MQFNLKVYNNSLVKGISKTIIISGVIFFLNFLIKILLSKYLDPSELGKFNLIQSYFSFVLIIASLNIFDYGIKISSNDKKIYSFLKKSLKVYLISSLIGYFILFFYVKFFDINSLIYIYLILPVVVFKLVFDLYGSIYIGSGNSLKKLIFVDFSPSLIFFLLLILLHNYLSLTDIITTYAFYFSIILIPVLLLIKDYKKIKESNENINLKEIFKYSFPLYVASLVSLPVQFISILIEKKLSLEALANYGLILSLVGLISLLPNIIEMTTIKNFKDLLQFKRINLINQKLKILRKSTLLIVAPIGFTFIYHSSEIVEILFTKRYTYVSEYLPYFSIIAILNTITVSNQTILMLLSQTKFILKTKFIVISILILFSYPLLHYFSFFGLVFIYFILNSISTLIMYPKHLFFNYGIILWDKYLLIVFGVILASSFITHLIIKYILKVDNATISILIFTFILMVISKHFNILRIKDFKLLNR